MKFFLIFFWFLQVFFDSFAKIQSENGSNSSYFFVQFEM